MIVYNVTISLLDESIHEEWIDWMREVHIPEVMGLGIFRDHRILRLLNEEDGGITYAIQYRCETMEQYQRYQLEFAPAMQAETQKYYGGKFAAFRTLLEEL